MAQLEPKVLLCLKLAKVCSSGWWNGGFISMSLSLIYTEESKPLKGSEDLQLIYKTPMFPVIL